MRHSHFPSLVRSALPLVLGLSMAGSACRGEQPAAAAAPTVEPRIDVPAIRVGLTDLEATLQVSGNLVPQNRVAVMAKLPGTLSRIDVQIGDRVRAGQPVAWLDRRELDAQVDAATAAVNVARAALDAAEAALANAILENDRATNLFDRGALPRQRLETAQTANRAATAQRDLATANLAQADAALRRAREVQRDATLTSPIDGVIVERNYDAGSLVSPSERPVVAIADLRVLKLEAGVSETDTGKLRVGMPARVTVQAYPGVVFDGQVAAIAPEVDARNRHFKIDVRTTNRGNSLLSGMYGIATIPLQRVTQVVAVPREAIVNRNGARVVYRIDEDTVHDVVVREGIDSGTLVQIPEGLQPGDTIVADARRTLEPGTKVNAVLDRDAAVGGGRQ